MIDPNRDWSAEFNESRRAFETLQAAQQQRDLAEGVLAGFVAKLRVSRAERKHFQISQKIGLPVVDSVGR